jgi:hypothetical protein
LAGVVHEPVDHRGGLVIEIRGCLFYLLAVPRDLRTVGASNCDAPNGSDASEIREPRQPGVHCRERVVAVAYAHNRECRVVLADLIDHDFRS